MKTLVYAFLFLLMIGFSMSSAMACSNPYPAPIYYHNDPNTNIAAPYCVGDGQTGNAPVGWDSNNLCPVQNTGFYLVDGIQCNSGICYGNGAIPQNNICTTFNGGFTSCAPMSQEDFDAYNEVVEEGWSEEEVEAVFGCYWSGTLY